MEVIDAINNALLSLDASAPRHNHGSAIDKTILVLNNARDKAGNVSV